MRNSLPSTICLAGFDRFGIIGSKQKECISNLFQNGEMTAMKYVVVLGTEWQITDDPA